jgi:rubrerythrin
LASDSSVQVRDPYAVVKDLGADHDAQSIARILNKCAPETGPNSGFAAVSGPAIWGAGHYGLERSSLFAAMSTQQQDSILKKLGIAILEEAQFIELAGMSFTAKMSLLSNDHQQRQLYSFFAADEARHLRLISDLVGAPKAGQAEQNSFLQYLGKVIQTESRLPLMFLSQIILEGWGLTHYTTLAERAQNQQVRETLNSIVADEARHHGSGLVMFNEKNLTPHELESIDGWLSQFLEMIRVGPYSVIAHLARENQGLTESEIHLFLTENKFEDKVQADLQMMSRLMRKSGANEILRRCEQRGLMTSPNVGPTAAKIASSF